LISQLSRLWNKAHGQGGGGGVRVSEETHEIFWSVLILHCRGVKFWVLVLPRRLA
jgi:hypothetical protein